MGTYISIYGKLLVINHSLVEVGTNDVGVESGSSPFFQFSNAAFAVFDDADDMV